VAALSALTEELADDPAAAEIVDAAAEYVIAAQANERGLGRLATRQDDPEQSCSSALQQRSAPGSNDKAQAEQHEKHVGRDIEHALQGRKCCCIQRQCACGSRRAQGM
jgi:hypothetical protein